MPKYLRTARSRKPEQRTSVTVYFLRWLLLGLCAVGVRHVLIAGSQNTQDRHLRALSDPSLDHPVYTRLANPNVQSQQDPSSSPLIRDVLLQVNSVSAETIWESLLEEAAALMKTPTYQQQQTTAATTPKLIAMEVGMFRAKQCLQAARLGLEAHCVEPSPRAFQRITAAVRKDPEDVQARVHLHQKAAAALPGLTLNFTAAGTTGDHVGVHDVWNMKPGMPENEEIKAKIGQPIQVPSLRLDDLIAEIVPLDSPDRIFLLKVDTQGYEPSVFAGLEFSVFLQRRVDYIMFEYWPKGMDLLTLGDVSKRACVAHFLLQALHEAGYTLFALPNTGHPAAPREGLKALGQEEAPMNDFRDNCLYYYQLEDRFPGDYRMGYWSDFLAVAPGASLVQNPVTEVGQLLQHERMTTIRKGPGVWAG